MTLEVSVDKDKLLELVEKNNNLPRKHADYFNWPDKVVKELDIANIFAMYAEQLWNISISHATSLPEGRDPPDIAFKTSIGEVGVELVELVDEDAIR